MRHRIYWFTVLLLTTLHALAYREAETKLTGTVIGTELSVDYGNGSTATTKVNTRECAFDGDLSTFFASYERSKTWVGLDLGTPHVITHVGWSPRNDGLGPRRMVLALFEGANSPDFMDAVPLHLIDQEGVIGTMSYADVHVSRAFRYVRYVGPADARCNVAEVEFYGRAGEGDDSMFYQLTNIPTVSIHTAGAQDPFDKVTEIPSAYTIVYENGTRIQEEAGGTRLRGNASFNFPKKPYRLKLESKKHMFKGDTIAMRSPAKAKKWTLINNYGDKTLMRNIVAFEVARRMGMAYVPWCQPVDVIVNGEYKGCYQLTDQITTGPARVDITEMSPEDNDGEALTGGYLLELDGYAEKETSWFRSRYGQPVTIKAPDENDITVEQHRYIEDYFNRMETSILAGNFAHPTQGYRSMLDAQSLMQYMIVEEVVANPDAFWSCYMYKERGRDTIHVGPVWDFDNGFDNDWRCYPTSSQPTLLFLHNSGAGNVRTMLQRILQDNTYTDSLKMMWDEARAMRGITEESLLHYIDSTAEVLQASQRLNFLRWPILSQKVHENPVALGSYEAEVGMVKNFLAERLTWLDIQIASLNATPQGEMVEINTAEDLADFARRVNNGETTLSARLMADVDFTSYPSLMIGNSRHYAGTFDGAGHTITIRLERRAENAGLFCLLDGTVKDLTVRGTLKTNSKYAGGICAQMFGATLLRCQSYVDITSTVNGDGTHGGLTGLTSEANSISQIESCLFAGSIQGSQTNCCGGLVGWATAPVIAQNCLMIGDITVSSYGSDMISRNNGNLIGANNHYKTSWHPQTIPQGAYETSNYALRSGELCYTLNQGLTDGTQNWYQTLSEDPHPLPDPRHETVGYVEGIYTGLAPDMLRKPAQPTWHGIYDLQGRRLAHPTGKGIYIINGKKTRE